MNGLNPKLPASYPFTTFYDLNGTIDLFRYDVSEDIVIANEGKECVWGVAIPNL